MAERMAEMEEDIGDVPAGEDDNDSDRDEDDRLFAWMVNDDMDEDEVEDEQPLDTEASESFELDTPAERSGHIAVVDRNIMYVWGGYKVRSLLDPTSAFFIIFTNIFLQSAFLFKLYFTLPLYKNAQNNGFYDLYLPRSEIWTYNMESGVW